MIYQAHISGYISNIGRYMHKITRTPFYHIVAVDLEKQYISKDIWPYLGYLEQCL